MTLPLAPCIPETAPFTPEQRAWLNGFLAGLFSRQAAAPAVAPAPAAPARALTVLWGSQTGTAEALAKQAAKAAAQRGFAPRLLDMAAVGPDEVRAAGDVLVITSTYGDGEPPDNAKALHAALRGATDPCLNGVRFAVCALGDSNYTLFCQCGKDFDEALARLGATRMAERVDCDIGQEASFTRWLQEVLGRFAGASPSAAASAAVLAEPAASPSAAAGHSRQRPFAAPVLAVRRLSGVGSAKEVNHVEFSLEGSGLQYEAGDALGVYPQNCPALVDEVLAALGCDGEEPVETAAGERPLRTALRQHLDLGRPPAPLLELLGLTARPELHQVIDALLQPPNRRPAPKAFAAALRPLQPRLYSISSSPKAHPGQVHLTVGAVRYEAHGRPRQGVCSTFLAERALAAGTVGVFVHVNTGFRLPADGTVPVIMVGPGTGIAPFRAFLQERAETGATGRNWLFFGDQHAATDFLYREELETWLGTGRLSRLHTAFSRDQAEKVYVQHRMREQARELWRWLEEGAHFYVCGDASRMAKDVDAALHEVVQTAGGKSPDAAAEYVQALRAGRRYARDVY